MSRNKGPEEKEQSAVLLGQKCAGDQFGKTVYQLNLLC